MASLIAPYIINAAIDSLLRGQSFFSFGTTYLALLVAEPYAEPPYYYFDTEHEVTYTGYARRSIASTLTAWRGTDSTTAVSTGTSGMIRPAATQFFPLCTTSSQIVTHAALLGSNVREPTYNMVAMYWELQRPIQLSNTSPGFYPALNGDTLTLRIDN